MRTSARASADITTVEFVRGSGVCAVAEGADLALGLGGTYGHLAAHRRQALMFVGTNAYVRWD